MQLMALKNHCTYNCTDDDECTDGSHNCDSSVKADCYNTVGSFRCSCKEGFLGDGTAGNCTGLYVVCRIPATLCNYTS